jgi:predicted transcriptional regulator
METFEKIKALLDQTQSDIEKFFAKGNSSAGTRVRQAMQELKKLAQELRTEVQEAKNSNKD